MKKRSEQLEPPYVFFVDRCLGKGLVPQALKSGLLAAEQIKIHDEHYLPTTTDVAWLTEVGTKGWVVLSQDQNITRNPLEQRALLDAKVAFFGLTGGDATGAEKAASLAQGLEGIRRALRRFGVPLIASVSREGDVTVKWAAGQRLEKPRRIAATKRR